MRPRLTGLRVATIAIIALHLSLLVASVPDYRVSIDSAYHAALGRQYAEHGVYFWDQLHYQPAGRPNLQGPAIHLAIAFLGRALGGSGDDFVRANALLGVAGWLLAVATAAFFAQRLGGDRAALLAVATLAGSGYASTSFSLNLPSGWMFVATPWAIHCFLERRLALAVGFIALACYSHLGGFSTAPLGVAIAALLSRRLRDLAWVGLAVVLVTAPYWVHFLRSLAWYVGQNGDTTWWIDPLVDLFWVVGLVAAMRAPRESALLIAWAAAPLVWVIQDPTRFILQSSLAGAVLGGVAIGRALDGWRSALSAVRACFARDAAWIADHCEPNILGDPPRALRRFGRGPASRPCPRRVSTASCADGNRPFALRLRDRAVGHPRRAARARRRARPGLDAGVGR